MHTHMRNPPFIQQLKNVMMKDTFHLVSDFHNSPRVLECYFPVIMFLPQKTVKGKFQVWSCNLLLYENHVGRYIFCIHQRKEVQNYMKL